MKYIIYDNTGKILRRIQCPPGLSLLQAKDSEFVMEGTANDVTQKVKFDGLDEKGQPVNPRIVDKTPEEIEADNPPIPEIPEGERPAHITNAQWQEVLLRLKKLESKA